MKSYTKIKKQLLCDEGVRKAYNKLGPEYLFARSVIEKRIERGLTQAALARKIGTRQSAIARLESGCYNPTVGFLERVARALDVQLVVSFSGKRSSV